SIFKDDTMVTLGNPVQQAILYLGIESRTIHGGDGNDTITDPGSDTQIFGDEGNDTIVVNATSGNGVVADGGEAPDTYNIVGGDRDGPITVADSGASGTDSIKIVGTSGNDAVIQASGGFTLNGTSISTSGLEAASVDGGGGGDTFSIEGTPTIVATV